MNGFYYTGLNSSEVQVVMIITIVVGILLFVLGIWVMFSIISMSHSLSDIRDIMRNHFVINDVNHQTEQTDTKETEQTTDEQQ